MKTVVKFIAFLYVPVASVGLVLLFAYWLNGAVTFDPLTAAQNKRIRFQSGGESSVRDENLTAAEATLAESMMHADRPVDGQRAQLLYIGNSQTIAIMDQNPGDMISPQWLQILLARQESGKPPTIQISIGSLPNITMPELLIKMVAERARSPRARSVVIASAVLEEFRGLGVRDEVANLADTPGVKARLATLVAQNTDLETVNSSLATALESGASSPAPGVRITDPSLAGTIEDRLQRWVERLPVFAKRQALQGEIYLAYYDWRNRVLGINSASARPVPESAYHASLQMIELALRYAKTEGITLVVYLAPIRPIQPNPNVPADVARFRRDVPALCQRYASKCLDYVDLVPESLWTNYPDDASGTQGQRDYAHFTGKGHKLVAQTLLKDVGQQIEQKAEENISRP